MRLGRPLILCGHRGFFLSPLRNWSAQKFRFLRQRRSLILIGSRKVGHPTARLPLTFLEVMRFTTG